MLQINLQNLFIHFIKFSLNLKEFQEFINYFKSYQVNKIGYFVEIYFNLNLHLNLNIKPDFQVNSQFSTFLHDPCVNIKEFFPMSHQITTVLLVIHDTLNVNPTSEHNCCETSQVTCLHAHQPTNYSTLLVILYLLNATIQSQRLFLQRTIM